MMRIPAVGERVYAWRAGQASKVRIPGEVVDKHLHSWTSRAIYVRMDDTGEIEGFGYWDLDEIPAPLQETPKTEVQVLRGEIYAVLTNRDKVRTDAAKLAEISRLIARESVPTTPRRAEP